MRVSQAIVALLLFVVAASVRAEDAETFIPRAQDKPPGPALSPAEAIAKMTVPDGFTVELVASEPDIVNPVAMTFDERGRVWITESLEYPRLEAGPGRDRVKVLEDTDGDGRADKFTTFAEGLNIPSGIAVGHGGVWVANAPDLLFMQDTDGDLKADKQEVVLTGFGRFDTHELPNSLTWGPDGWLYGINGVFNPSHIEYRGKTYDFTCALFRFHPKTREFEVFAEGTSNPWGVAFDNEGSAFFSACVIDHLWHIAESGYYHRQGGPYPPFAWKMGSIVEHRHQKAAYCGITFFDSDAYPAEYRERLYMGNIHGGCINVDVLQRDGSTYVANPAPDFLTANDAWFMPVVQKTGPDGSLYVLDWYDRYHCYQDANRDPQGVDRLKGRLYRVRYRDTPRVWNFDRSKDTDEALIQSLASGNVYDRDIAQRLLAERNSPAANAALAKLVLNAEVPRKARMHALWSLIGAGPLDPSLHIQLLEHEDPSLRAWGVRAAGNQRKVKDEVARRVAAMTSDTSRDVLLQVAIAARKIEGLAPAPILAAVLANSGDDKAIPHVAWQNLHPLLEEQSEEFLELMRLVDIQKAPGLSGMLPYLVERILARQDPDPRSMVTLFDLITDGPIADAGSAQRYLATLSAKIQTGEMSGPRLESLKMQIEAPLKKILLGPKDGPLYLDAALLATTWTDPTGLSGVRHVFSSPDYPGERRLQALNALIAAADEQVLTAVADVLPSSQATPIPWRGEVLDALGRMEDPQVAEVVLATYAKLEPELQPRAIELLTGRAAWAEQLLAAIGSQQIPAEALNLNQVRKLLASDSPEVVEQVKATWGTLRTERNPQREEVIGRMRRFIRTNPGDAHAGVAVFKKACAQCHKIYGEGQDVGPNITSIGRTNFEQLLSNVFDPSLVIGAAYQPRTVVTADGRVLTGLLVEESEQRVVLKIQGGKLEVIPREDVEEMEVNKLSMMPEELEKQLQPEELANLFAFLTLDRPPSDPEARRLPGVGQVVPRETLEPTEFNELLGEVAPGFSVLASGERGVGLLSEHLGRSNVVRTHPVDGETACVLRSTVDVPADKKTRLLLSVAHDPQGDWRLVVKASGDVVHDSIIGPATTANGWADITIDLSRFAGQKVELELLNQANNWAWEYAYWGRAELVSE